MREDTLPTVGFRSVNEAFAASTGSFERKNVALKYAGGDMDIDVVLTRNTPNGNEVRARHQMLKSKSLGQHLASKLINGDSSVDAEEFDGLATLLDTAITGDARIVQHPTANSSALSCKYLDQLLDAVDSNLGTKALIMTKAMRRNLTSFLRSSQSISTDRDAFGMQVMTYGGALILEADENGGPATISEDASGLESIYCVALGESGWKIVESQAGLSVRNLGERTDTPAERIRVDWTIAPVDESKRCIARLFNVSNTETAVA